MSKSRSAKIAAKSGDPRRRVGKRSSAGRRSKRRSANSQLTAGLTHDQRVRQRVTLAARALHELSSPSTLPEQWAWIDARGKPDYLALPLSEFELSDGSMGYFVRPISSDESRKEIQRVYHDAFHADDRQLPSKTEILKSYTASFPYLAFDEEGWLWPLWQQWRARYTVVDHEYLEALSSGIASPGWGWMPKGRARVWVIAQARRRVRTLSADEILQRRYREWWLSQRTPNEEVRTTSDQRLLAQLIQRIEEQTGYRTTGEELRDRGLAYVLRRAVSMAFHVRQRDLD